MIRQVPSAMQAPENPPPPPARPPDLEADATVVVPDSPASQATFALPPPAATPSSAPPGSLAGRLRPGDVLADGRYRIVRFLGEGGMGSVYEALDGELDARVALKTLRAETTAPSALERFKREIQVARQVTHPNVCRLYDLGRHRSPDGQDVLFLTMQYLDGETLRERLSRGGPFSPAQAFPLVRDMAAALDAAHQAGIVHRDFKSGNVMLVPSREGLRAVVTDFGLAREVDSGRETLTATAGFVGTPAYSSPEQIQGFEVGPASDLYAFGVVLYEMSTGRLPYDDAPTPWIAVVRRLNEMPTAPLELVKGLPEGWNAAILRCLDREPENRFATAWEVAEALEPCAGAEEAGSGGVSPPGPDSGSRGRPASRPGGSRPSTGSRQLGRANAVPDTAGRDTAGYATEALPLPRESAPPPRRIRPRELVLIALGALLLLAGLGYAFLRPGPAPAPAPSQPGAPADPAAPVATATARPAIALLGFKNLRGNADAGWISTALTEMLAMEVASGDALRVIPGEQVARMKTELRLGDDEGYDRERLARVRANLGSDLVVIGSYFSENDALRLDLRVQNASDGEVISSLSEKGKESDLIALVERVGDRLRRELGLSGLAPAEAQAVRAAFPESSAVARVYAQGLAHLHRFDLVEATRLLEQAAQEAPGNPMVLAALSEAYQLAGYETKADDVARRADLASRQLPTRYRLWIEGGHYEAARDWPRAIETFQSLARLYPDDLEVALRLAKLQMVRASRFDDALATLAGLERLPPPARGDPRIDLLKTFALLRKGQPEQALVVAEGAAAESHSRGAVITEASAYAYIGSAQLARGNHDLALAAVEKARQLFLSVGYREGASQTLNSIAQVLRSRGDWAGARQRLEEAISLQRQIGVTAKLRSSLGWLGTLHQLHGEVHEALGIYRECLEMSEGLDDQLALYRRNYGDALQLLGDFDGARQALDLAAAHAERMNDRKMLIELGNSRAEMALTLGRLDEAEKEYSASQEFYRQTGQVGDLANITLSLAAIDLWRGALGKAGEKLRQVEGLRQAEKHELNYLERRLLEGALALEEKRPAEAEKILGEQLAVPGPQQIARYELDALTQLARLELARGSGAAALRYAERAAAKVGDLEILWRRLLYAARIERIRGLAGDAAARDAARRRLTAVRSEAAAKNIAAVVFEADLALGELALADGDPAGRQALEKLEAAATAAGYGSFARRAAAALGTAG